MFISSNILSGCKNKDPKFQEQLFKLCYVPFMKMVLRYTQNEDEAKDVINKGFFKILTKINMFDGDEHNFYAWCKKILINESLDHIKSSTFSQSFNFSEPKVDDAIIYPESDFTTESDLILYYLRKLPVTTATVFNLFALEGYSHKEIAALIGINEGNSKWHLHSAREKLQSWIFKNTVK